MDYFDLHCDTISKAFDKGADIFDKSNAVNLRDISAFEHYIQTFAIFIKDDEPQPFTKYKKMLSFFKSQKEKLPKDLEYILAVEGGAVLENDVDRLYELEKDKIKLLSLAWNNETDLAGGVYSNKSLTPVGEKAIVVMNELKIACDLSHLNEKSFYKALEKSDKVLATHSNCFEITPHKRNLKKAQISALAEKRGVLGLCFYPDFLGEDIFEKIYKNIFLIADMGLEDIISIGSDFDGGVMDKRLDSTLKIPELYSFLGSKGLKKSLLDKIFYKNAYNFIANF